MGYVTSRDSSAMCKDALSCLNGDGYESQCNLEDLSAFVTSSFRVAGWRAVVNVIYDYGSINCGVQFDNRDEDAWT